MSGDDAKAEELSRPDQLDYEALWAETTGLDSIEALGYFEQHLPYICRDAYQTRTRRPAVFLRVRHDTFEYVFDHYTSLEATGVVPYSRSEESRLVVAFGRSAPKTGAVKLTMTGPDYPSMSNSHCLSAGTRHVVPHQEGAGS